MRRLTSAHHDPRRDQRQFDLFAPTNAASAPKVPEWRSLPVETRQALTHLMARLSLDHADGNRAPLREETCHED